MRKAAGRVSPGREPVRVLLARSDDVDKLNEMAQSRRWQEWLDALEATKPNRDRKRDSYRLHNLAVANEAIAYEATALEEQAARLRLAARLMTQAVQQNPGREVHRRVAVTHPEERRRLRAAGRAVSVSEAHAADATDVAAGSARPPGARRSAEAAAMTNKDVIDLRGAGLDDDNLIAAIKDAKTVNFDLSPAGLKALLTAKVSNRVITAMRARGQ